MISIIFASLLSIASPSDPLPILSLADALAYAAENDPHLKAAEAQVQVGEAQKGMARSGFLPRVDVQGQYQRTTANFVISPMFSKSPIAKTVSLDNSLDSYNYLTFGASLTQVVFDFGKTAALYQSANERLNISRSNHATMEAMLGLQVSELYFNVLKAKELVVVAEAAVSNQDKHVKQIEQFVLAGTRPKIDLETSKLDSANAHLTLSAARTQLDLLKAQLNSAIGRSPQTVFDVVAPVMDELSEEQLSAPVLMERFSSERPEWGQINAQLHAQEIALRAAWAGYLPAVIATANATGAKTGDFAAGYNGYVGVGLSWNLFGGLQNWYQVNEAQAGYQAALAQKQELERQILAEITKSLLTLHEAQQRLDYTQQASETARERLTLAESRYQAGVGTVIELDDAQIAFTDATAARVQAQFDIAVYRAELLYSLGRKPF